MNNLFYTGESQSSKKEGIIALKQGRLSVGFSFIKTNLWSLPFLQHRF